MARPALGVRLARHALGSVLILLSCQPVALGFSTVPEPVPCGGAAPLRGRTARTWLSPLRMKGGASEPKMDSPSASRASSLIPSRMRFSTPTTPRPPPTPPPGNGIRTGNGCLWANDFVLIDGFESSVGLDVSDGRGVFLRWFEKSADTPVRKIVLGKLRSSRFLAGARQKLWWLVPSWGQHSQDIPNETQFILLRMSDPEKDEPETYALILTMVSGPFRSNLGHGREDSSKVVLTVESNDRDVLCDKPTDVAFMSTGSDPYRLLEEGFAAVADRVQTFNVRSKKKLPPTLDYFGWCTWDAFYSEVNGPGIEKGLKSFREGGVTAKVLIIDDGWQHTDNDQDIWIANPNGTSTSPVGRVSRLWQRAMASVNRQVEKISTKVSSWLEWYFFTKVDQAPLGSIHIKIWGLLANTILKAQLLDTYARRMDFTKRLMSPRASDRFLSSLSPEHKSGDKDDEGGVFKGWISRIKDEHKILYVYCWHALLGYWSGVGGEYNQEWGTGATGLGAAPVKVQPSSGILEVEPQLRWDPLLLNKIGMTGIKSHGLVGGTTGGPDGMKAGARALSRTIHRYLRQSGVDGVKVDAQAASVMMGQGLGGSANVAREYIRAMEESVQENFGPDNHCINCMCHPTECVYSYKTTSVARVSDDFYPRDTSSHTVHIVNVAYNSVFLGEVMQPDWDMFQSAHPAGLLHAAARAVSGGAVYVSDHPDSHDFGILKRLVLSDGRTLRAQLPGRPTRDMLFADVTSDMRSALKVYNRNTCGGVVGAFNVQGAEWCKQTRGFSKKGFDPTELSTTIRPRDVEGLTEGEEGRKYAAFVTQWAANGTLVASWMRVLGRSEGVEVRLHSKDAGIATFVQLGDSVTSTGRAVHAAPMGLREMFNCGGSVLSHELGKGEDGFLRGKAKFIGEGSFLVISSKAPELVTLDGVVLPFVYTSATESDPGHFIVDIPTMDAGGSARELVYTFEGVAEVPEPAPEAPKVPEPES